MDYLGFFGYEQKVMYFLKKRVILIMVIKVFFKLLLLLFVFKYHTQILFMIKITL